VQGQPSQPAHSRRNPHEQTAGRDIVKFSCSIFLWSLNCVAVFPTTFRLRNLARVGTESTTDQSDLPPSPPSIISDQIPELIPVEADHAQLSLKFPDDLIFSTTVEDYYHTLSGIRLPLGLRHSAVPLPSPSNTRLSTSTSAPPRSSRRSLNFNTTIMAPTHTFAKLCTTAKNRYYTQSITITVPGGRHRWRPPHMLLHHPAPARVQDADPSATRPDPPWAHTTARR
jgi:hypothetical protein